MATTLRTAAERSRWFQFVEGLGLPADVEAKKHRPTRSSKQNRYLRAVETAIGDHVGYSMGEVHSWILGDFFGWKDHKGPRTPKNPDGIVSVPVRTTTTNEDGKRQVLSKTEFAAFARHVEKIAAQAGVFITDRWES